MDRMVRDAKALQDLGIGVAAISANDAAEYPADSFDNMKLEAAKHGFSFPYLYDESQAVAQAYGAACTPDFFGFNAAGGLQYRGRLDASGRQAAAPDVRRELYEGMKQVAETGRGPRDQVASMGCSIKWKAAGGGGGAGAGSIFDMWPPAPIFSQRTIGEKRHAVRCQTAGPRDL